MGPMGDPPSAPDEDAIARAVMDDNTKCIQQLREAVQQLHNPDGQPGDELVRDIARVVTAANAMLHGTSWDPPAKAAYADWQAVDAGSAAPGALVAAAEQVRDAGEAMLDAAGTQATEDPTRTLQDWPEGRDHLATVVSRAAATCATLGRPPPA
jgi:hypothetical protein